MPDLGKGRKALSPDDGCIRSPLTKPLNMSCKEFADYISQHPSSDQAYREAEQPQLASAVILSVTVHFPDVQLSDVSCAALTFKWPKGLDHCLNYCTNCRKVGLATKRERICFQIIDTT